MWSIGAHSWRTFSPEYTSNTWARTGASSIAAMQPMASSFFLDRLSAFLSEDIGGALNGGVKVCQRNLINELPPLVTKYVLNLVREDATPLQCGFQSSPLSRI